MIFAGYLMTLFVTNRQSSSIPAAGAGPPLVEQVAPPTISEASAAFDQPHYVLRVRTSWLAVFARMFVEYDILAIPSSAGAEFSFSWATALMRREPSGPDLLRLSPGKRHLVIQREYVVTNPTTSAALGKFVPRGSDWEIVDALGRTMADVARITGGIGVSKYVVKMGDEQVALLTWAMHGFTLGSAEVDVEFLPAADQWLDRALTMALAALLEDQERRARQRSAE